MTNGTNNKISHDHPHATYWERLNVRVGPHLRDIVFGAIDGIITTFAVVSATVGGALNPIVILVLGISNLFADGFSMAAGNFLGTRSEDEVFYKELSSIEEQVRRHPERAKQEVRALLAAHGYGGDNLERMLELVTANEQYFVDFLLHEKAGLVQPTDGKPLRNGAITLASFVTAGLIPLLPYIIFFRADVSQNFVIAIIATLFALSVVGALRTIFTTERWWAGTLEMLFVGGAAASIAYFVGYALRFLV